MHRFLLGMLVFATGCATVDQMARDAIDSRRVRSATWDTDASSVRGESGLYVFSCPANPALRDRSHPVWGSGPYTDDSSVCRAGVHAGVITYDRGGRVTVELLPGQNSYRGSTRNGVETQDYGSWGNSFAVVR